MHAKLLCWFKHVDLPCSCCLLKLAENPALPTSLQAPAMGSSLSSSAYYWSHDEGTWAWNWGGQTWLWQDRHCEISRLGDSCNCDDCGFGWWAENGAVWKGVVPPTVHLRSHEGVLLDR